MHDSRAVNGLRRMVAALAALAAAVAPAVAGAPSPPGPPAVRQAPPATAATPTCGARHPVAIQVLGSGGPELLAGRAGSSYLVWVAGRARVLVDLGPGGMQRFHEAGAELIDLELLALSHLHVDHSADLPALVKAGFFGSREAPLPVAGPAAAPDFPGVREWIAGLFDAERGPFRYLAGALDGEGGYFALVPREFAAPTAPVRVHERDGLAIDAIAVPHGPVPALGYRVQVGGRTIVFGGDQNAGSPAFWEFAARADVLVAHLAVPDDVGGPARALHATPAAIGTAAGRAGVRAVVLSHWMSRSLAAREANVASVRRGFGGPLVEAEDLACIEVPTG